MVLLVVARNDVREAHVERDAATT